LEDMCIYLVAEPIWQLNLWVMPQINKFLASLDKFGKASSTKTNEIKVEKEIIKVEEKPKADTVMSINLFIKRPLFALVENVTDENSRAIILDCQIGLEMQMSSKKGMSVDVDLNNLSLYKVNIGDPKALKLSIIQNWGLRANYSDDSKGFKVIDVEMLKLKTTLSYQDYSLLMATQERWLKVIGEPKKDDKKDDKKDEKKEKTDEKTDDETDEKKEEFFDDEKPKFEKFDENNVSLNDEIS
jgi:hypothetical protein